MFLSVLLGVTLLLVAHRVNAVTYPARVDDLYQTSDPLDSDHDGLTDQGETRIFLTSPTVADTDADGYSDGAEVMIGSDPNAADDPASSLTAASDPSSPFPWPWILIRVSGISSFLLVFCLAISGMMMTAGWWYRVIPPNIAWSLHRTIGLTLILSILLHITGLLFDTFFHFGIIDVLVPFVAPYRAVWVGLGVLAFYAILLVVYTSVYQIQRHAGFWRFTHFLSFPMFILLFLHGIYAGTDTSRPWLQGMYWGTGGMMAVAVFARLAWKYLPRQPS